VVKDVPDFALVVGNPARLAGWRCVCGARIDFEREICAAIGKLLAQSLEDGVVEKQPWYEPSLKVSEQPIVDPAFNAEFDTVIVDRPRMREAAE
jgi:acyl-[acyl carrier protein]--UDP-N-acetylglucosamine O-acyltransferase